MQKFDFEGFIASLLRQKYHNVAAKICLNFTYTFTFTYIISGIVCAGGWA